MTRKNDLCNSMNKLFKRPYVNTISNLGRRDYALKMHILITFTAEEILDAAQALLIVTDNDKGGD